MTHKTVTLPDGTEFNVHLKGRKKDVHDTRDFKLKTAKPVETLPPAVDNSQWCSLPEDQGIIGSCTAHATAGVLEYNDRRFNVKPTELRVSRLFTYYATRTIEDTVNEDSGASMRNAIKSVATYGCIKESRWWYDVTKFAVNPSKKIWADAATDKITSYHRIDDGDINTMKATLAHGYVIAFGFEVFDEMMSAAVAATGVLPTPIPGETSLGGHAVVIVGYDDTKRMFKVRNSWGRAWGQKGYFWMSYDYVGNKELCSDFWVVVSAVTI